MTEPIHYVSDDAARRDARPPRSPAMWLKLLLVWGAGLVSWMIYIAIILYVFFRLIL
ncbi:MAG TPA: hypothetical protein VGR35_22935 [Tepidisphaeraceae bacterium]|nr:hypothetical protein [Tepidisphaeraceae bacterium]